MIKQIVPVLLVLTLAACGGDVAPKSKGGTGVDINANTNNTSANSGTDAGTNEDGGTDVPDATMSSPDAPSFLELTASPTSLTDLTPTTVSAIVTDPQGAEDIVAVRLLEQSTGAALGNFSADGGGAYSFALDWSSLSNSLDLTFDTNLNVVLTAEAIDAAGERSTRSVQLRVTCAEGGPACDATCGDQLCEGVCEPPGAFDDDPANCGGCGVPCDGRCVDGECLDVIATDAPCNTINDCQEGAVQCVSQADMGPTGGWCIFDCQEGPEQCPVGSACVRVGDAMQSVQICLPECAGGNDCRTDWMCISGPDVTGNATQVCAPPQPPM